jgi:hypothetical protein
MPCCFILLFIIAYLRYYLLFYYKHYYLLLQCQNMTYFKHFKSSDGLIHPVKTFTNLLHTYYLFLRLSFTKQPYYLFTILPCAYVLCHYLRFIVYMSLFILQHLPLIYYYFYYYYYHYHACRTITLLGWEGGGEKWRRSSKWQSPHHKIKGQNWWWWWCCCC